ncbi:MAG: hypothetical protein Ct9H300mP11_31370 [Chloroflexota bacterium]|nr:MAG: hypothetical protein Ct9H300mP11_31370 [Chloroflexota bacterium]
MTIKIDLRVPPCKPVPEVTAFIQECEAAGFNGVEYWIPKCLSGTFSSQWRMHF